MPLPSRYRNDPEVPIRLARVRALIASGQAQRLREGARLSLHDVALSIGVDDSAVCLWENHRREPRSSVELLAYEALLKRLEASQRDWVFNVAGIPKPS